MSRLKPRPTFSEAQEAASWASHDSMEYIDYSKSRRMIFRKLNYRRRRFHSGCQNLFWINSRRWPTSAMSPIRRS
jgi:hypothetical protein